MSLVSIILPAYNAEKFISEAIESVLNQSYSNFELIVVNDGSTDSTSKIVLQYEDPRIRYFEQVNTGVSGARNLALDKMEGDYFCFLDADDTLTFNSISSRLRVFKEDKTVEFVDGRVINYNDDFTKELNTFMPDYNGSPTKLLASLSPKCFFGITWMIRRISSKQYRFDESIRHGEDLWFYIEASFDGGDYAFVDENIYLRRVLNESAMSDLVGLEIGYHLLYKKIKEKGILSTGELRKLRRRIKSIMAKSFLKGGEFTNALKSVIKSF